MAYNAPFAGTKVRYKLIGKPPEDAVFAFCLGNGISDLFKVNDMLYENGLKTIPTK